MAEELDKALGEINDIYSKYNAPQVPKMGVPEDIGKTPMPEVGRTRSMPSAGQGLTQGGLDDFLSELNSGLSEPNIVEKPTGIPDIPKTFEERHPEGYAITGHIKRGFQTLPNLAEKATDIVNKALGLPEKTIEIPGVEYAKKTLEPSEREKVEMEKMSQTLTGKIVGGVAEAPGAIAPYVLGGEILGLAKVPALLGSILNFAGIGAIERSDRGAAEVLKGIPQDVIMGGIFHYLGPEFKAIKPGEKGLAEGGLEVTRAGQTRLVKSGVMAAMFGGQALYETGDMQQAIASGFLGALLGATSGGKKEKGLFEAEKGKLVPVSKRLEREKAAKEASEKAFNERTEIAPGYDEGTQGFEATDHIAEFFKRQGPEMVADELTEQIDIGKLALSLIKNHETDTDPRAIDRMWANPAEGEVGFEVNKNAIVMKRIPGKGLVTDRIMGPDGTRMELDVKNVDPADIIKIFGWPEPGQYADVKRTNIIPVEKVTPIETKVPVRIDVMNPKPGGEALGGPSSPPTSALPGRGFDIKASEDLSGRLTDPKIGGYTVGPDGKDITTGYSVGQGGFDPIDSSPTSLSKHYEKNAAAYKGLNKGGWRDPDTGEVWVEPSKNFDSLSDAIKDGIKKDQKSIYDHKKETTINLKKEDGTKIFSLDKNGNIEMDSPVKGAEFVGVQEGSAEMDVPPMFMFNDSISGSTFIVKDIGKIKEALDQKRNEFLTPGTEVTYKGKSGYRINEKGDDPDTWTVYSADKPGDLKVAKAEDLKIPETIKQAARPEPERISLTHYGRPGREEISPEGFSQGPNAGTERKFYENNKPLFSEKEGLAKRSYWYAPGQFVEPRFERFGEPYKIAEDLKIFDPTKASPEDMKPFMDKRDEINQRLTKKWGFSGNTEQGAQELDYAAAKALGYDGLNTGNHVAIFKALSTRAETVSPEMLTRLKEFGERIGGKEQTVGFPSELSKMEEGKLRDLAGLTTLTDMGALIELSRDYISKTGEREASLTMGHEQIHLLKALKLTDAENKLLDNFYKPKPGMNSEEVQAEEIGKILAKGYGKGQLMPQSIKNIINKIADFLQKLGNTFIGMGYKLSDKQEMNRLIRDISSGEIGKRPIKETITTTEQKGRIAKDVQEEVRDDFRKSVTTIRGAWDGIKRLYAPGGRGEIGKRTVTEASRELSVMERSHDIFDKQMEVAEKAFDKMPIESQYAFSQSASTDATGRNQATPELRELRKTLKDISDAKAKEINSFDPEEGLVKVREAYWPGADNAAYQRAQGKEQGTLPPTRILEPTGFMKAKDFQEFNDMLKAGYVPTESNPIRQFRQKMLEWDRFIYTHKMLQQMEQTGDAVKIGSGDKSPVGWRPVPPPYGVTKTGRYIMTDQAAQVFENWLSRPLSSSRYFGDLYRTYMTASTALQRFQLFGFFHGGFVASEAMISRGALAMKQLYRVMTGQENPATFIKTAATVPLAAYQKYKIGKEIYKEWQAPGTSTDPRVIQAVDDIIRGGGGISQEKMFTSYWIDSMRKDFKEGKYIAGAVRSPFAIMEKIMKPLMQSYVPNLKLGAFEELSFELRKVKPGLSDAQYNSEMHQIWNRIDSRLGQVRWQRVFMNNSAKNLVQMVIRAPGWTGGTIAEIGGAPKDVYQYFKEWHDTKVMPKVMPDRVAYVLALAAGTMMLNAAMSAWFANKDPSQLTTEDYMAFDTGDIDEKGKIIRGMLPLYSKDVYAYAKAPANTIWHKTNPIIGLIYELAKNKDYYGTGITDSSTGLGTKIGDIGKYLAKAFIPFGERGREKIAEERGTTVQGTVLPAIGIMPAPSYFSQSKAEQKAFELGGLKMPSGGRTDEEFQRNQTLKVHIKRYANALAKGEDVQPILSAMTDDVQSGKLKQQDVMRFKEKLRGKPLEDSVARLSIKEALSVWKVSTTEEKRKIASLIFKKYRNLKDPNDKKEYAPEIEKISGDLSKIYNLGGE